MVGLLIFLTDLWLITCCSINHCMSPVGRVLLKPFCRWIILKSHSWLMLTTLLSIYTTKPLDDRLSLHCPQLHVPPSAGEVSEFPSHLVLDGLRGPHLLICPANSFRNLFLKILTDDASSGREGERICYHLNFPSFFTVIDFPVEEWWQVDEVISLSSHLSRCPPEIPSNFVSSSIYASCTPFGFTCERRPWWIKELISATHSNAMKSARGKHCWLPYNPFMIILEVN